VEDVKDGMDISLCALNIKLKQLSWAGANNPIWIVRQNGTLEELKANKQPIGKYADPKPFTTHHVNLETGDSIYIFTDGLQDQFGGADGKKFKAAKMKQLLQTINAENMDEKRKIILNAFETWKGSLEQVDDVCVIGVRI
jgi:serine phosphatase RsbU (regulator of sigma subunit)